MTAKLEAEIAKLKERIATLEEEATQLRELAFAKPLDFPPQLRLAPQDKRLLAWLFQRAPAVLTRQRGVLLLERHQEESPMERTVDAVIYRVRKGLEPYGLTVHTERNEGYYMDGKTARALAKIIEGLRADEDQTDDLEARSRSTIAFRGSENDRDRGGSDQRPRQDLDDMVP